MSRHYQGLPGNGLDQFISEFQEARRSNPLKTFLIVPTMRLAKLIGERISQGPIPGFTHQSVRTLQDFVEDLYKRSNDSKLLINNTDSQLIVHHLLKTQAEEFDLIVNNELGSHSNFVNELLLYLRTIYLFDADYPECLEDLQSPKSAQLANFGNLYEEYLKENNLLDDQGLTRWAIEYIQHNKLPHVDRLFIYGIYDPAPLQKQLLEVLIKEVPKIHYFEPYGSNKKIFGFNPLKSSNIPVQVESNREWEATLEERLYTYTSRKIDVNYEVEVFSARDSLEETRKIASKIKELYKEGIALDAIAVVFPIIGQAADRIREVFQDFGIPIDISIPTPFAQSPVAKAVLELVEVPKSNYELDAVLRLIDCHYYSFEWKDNEKNDRISFRRLKQFALKAGASRDREKWIEKLQDLKTQLEYESKSIADDEETKKKYHQDIIVLDSFIKGLKSVFKELSNLSGQKTIAEHGLELEKLIDKLGINKNIEDSSPGIVERDRRALSALMNILNALQKSQIVVPDNKMSLEEFYEFLRSMINTGKFRTQRQNRNRVQAVGPRELLHVPYDIVFFGGLTEGTFPRVLDIQYYITENEGERIGLLGQKGMLRQERFYFLNILLSPRKRLILSYSMTEGRRTTIPSIFLDEIKRLVSYTEIASSIGEQSWLVAFRRIGEKIKKREYDNLQFLADHPLGIEQIISKINIEVFNRTGVYDSEFDGILEGEEDIIEQLADQFGEDKAFSSSKIETYATCRFRFFLKYLIRLEEHEELTEGFDPMKRGTLVHQILYRFFSERKEKGLGKITDTTQIEDKERICKIAEQEFLKIPYRGAVWEAQRRLYVGEAGRYQGILEAVIDHEAESYLEKFQPTHFEMTIGTPRHQIKTSEEVVEEPIRLESTEDVSRSFLFEGFIDRIDVTEEREFIIMDYKTGYYSNRNAILNGKSFQLPLYLLAAEKKLDMKGVGGSYYALAHPSEVKKYLTIADKTFKDSLFPNVTSRSFMADFREVLNKSVEFALEFIDAIRRGVFPPNPSLDECPQFCEYRAICRHDPMRSLSTGGKI